MTPPVFVSMIGILLTIAPCTGRLLWYSRLTRDGRLVMGGQGPYREDPGLKPAQSALKKLESLFPEADSLTPGYIPAGRVAMTVDHYPQLCALDRGVFAGLGFNGSGVTTGKIIGKCLADLAKGEPSLRPVTQPKPFKMHGFGRIAITAFSALYACLDKRVAPQG
ncbi:MAG: hypothetical protein Q7J57_09190 [Gemmobacter sp.]|nr:hypothetical protein [Gemmobacter sp.]